ncbi:MAG TPA: ATP-binding protein [Bacteroidota bacterium]|nr:ATP-binding protein [Bacteroidota bacterium]
MNTNMKLKLSLQSRIFIGLSAIAVVSLTVMWMIVRPRYEASVMNERVTIIQQVQEYAVQNLDRVLASWAQVTQFVAYQVTDRPHEGESVLRNVMTLHPEIMQIRIYSPNFKDELSSNNINYTIPSFAFHDSVWIRSKIDSSLQTAWFWNAKNGQPVIVTRMRFQASSIPFVLTVMWDAKILQDYYLQMPLGGEYAVNILTSTRTLFQNQNTFDPRSVAVSTEQINRLQTFRQGTNDWHVVSAAFRTLDLRMVVAIPEHVVLAPVHELFLYTTWFVLGCLVLMLLPVWLLAYQINKPVKKLVEDVKRLSNLDFTQEIHIPRIRNLHEMGTTIEVMRQALERYQRMNVEKIILEEWKNKLFMTHTDEMIGLTDGTGAFLFRNERFDEFCSSLLPTRTLQTKQDVLTHPAVNTVKTTQREELAESLHIRLVQSEIRVQTTAETDTYFRVNDLSIMREEENLGSLLIFHDLTNERLIDKMKTEMINIVVHELRNPVGSIMGFAEIMLTDTSITEDERKEFLQLMLSSSKKLSDLINRFLDISRLESRRIDHPKVPIDVVESITSACELLKPQLLKKTLAIEYNIQPDIPAVTVAPDLFREAISNLVSNAIKYGGDSRTIEISLSATSSHFVFSILDHGYGIPAEAQEKLFTKFYRVRAYKSANEIGTGLGLAYVKEIVNFHGGMITLESNEAIGCKFTMTFPINFHQREEQNA